MFSYFLCIFFGWCLCVRARAMWVFFFIKPFKWGNIDLFYYYRAGEFTVMSILFHFWFVMVFFWLWRLLTHTTSHWQSLTHCIGIGYFTLWREFFNFKQITRASALHRNNIFIVIGLLHFQMNCTLTNRCDTISFQAIFLNYALALLDG